MPPFLQLDDFIHSLDCFGGMSVLGEHVQRKPLRNGGLADATVAHDNQLVIQLRLGLFLPNLNKCLLLIRQQRLNIFLALQELQVYIVVFIRDDIHHF